MTKNVINIRKDEKEPVVEKPVSKKKSEYEALLKAYEKQNPVKYKAKKESGQFDRQLKKFK